MPFQIEQLDNWLRPNVRHMQAYSSARSEYKGSASIWLDANENPFGKVFHRYPDPLQQKVKTRLAELKFVQSQQLFLGNGSDEVLDLVMRAFCVPGKDAAISCPPTYGMYRVLAELNDVELREVPLDDDFDLDVEGILAKADEHCKLLFLCSPNNPTGNAFKVERVRRLLGEFSGLVLIDEAYIEFAEQDSFVSCLEEFPNLIISQTLSKAWGLAGLRLGMAIAHTKIVEVLNRIKPPYNISRVNQEAALEKLKKEVQVAKEVAQIRVQRQLLKNALQELPFVRKVYPSDANFLLVKVWRPEELYDYLLEEGIVIRLRHRLAGCKDSVRFSIGSPAENERLVQALRQYGSIKAAAQSPH